MVPYKKILMSLITIVNLNCQLGRPKLFQIFISWFDEDVFYLYGGFKLERKIDSGKKSNLVKTMFRT